MAKWTPAKTQYCEGDGCYNNEMHPDGATGQSCGVCGYWPLWFPLPSKKRREQRSKRARQKPVNKP